MATVVGVLLVSLAIIGWDYYRGNVRSQLAEKYTKALMLGSEGRLEESAALLKGLENKAGSQYGTLGKLSQALISAKNGQETEAIEIYEAISKEKAVSENLRGFAQLQAAKYSMKAGDLENAQQMLALLTKPGGTENVAWRPLAMEMEGILQLKKGNKEEASKIFSNLLLSKTIPESMKNRVKVMALRISATVK